MLPPMLLAREDLQRTLGEHDFAAAFTLIKKWGGLSQNRIASACQLTPGKVSTIMSGRQQVTSMEVIRRIADGLRIPGHLVGLAARPWEQEQERQASPSAPPEGGEGGGSAVVDAVPWRPDATIGMAAQLSRSDLVMDRRAATRALTAAVITGTTLLDGVDGWHAPAHPDSRRDRRPGRLGARECADLEFTARQFRAWGRSGGGGLRRKAVAGQLAEVSAALDEHQTPAIESRLYCVLAQLAGTAATMAWDIGEQRRAQDYYRLALRASHAGGDRVFGANALAAMARQMLYRERPHDALELVRLAQDGVRDEAGPRMRAMLHTREAWAYARMGRQAGFLRATDQAGAALADTTVHDDEPHWISYFDHAELAGVTGGRMLDLARDDPRAWAPRAADHIADALAGRGPEVGRSHALDWIGLAECGFLQGDVHTAVDHTRRAVEVAERLQSGRVREQLARLYPHTVGPDVPRDVAEVRTSIRHLLTTEERTA